MNKNLVALVFALFSLSALANEFGNFPWLVKVESTYTDQLDKNRKDTFKGYGIVMSDVNRRVIITAAHLSQGGVEERAPNLKIEYFNPESQTFLPLKIIRRLALNEYDLEAIEVVPNSHIEPLVDWVHENSFYGHTRFPLSHKWEEKFLGAEDSGLVPHFKALGLKAFIPKVSLVEDGPGVDLQKKGDSLFSSHRIFGYQEFPHEILSLSRGVEGMSGLPMVALGSESYQKKWRVLGLYSAGSKTFHKSWYSRLENIEPFVFNWLQFYRMDNLYSYLSQRQREKEHQKVTKEVHRDRPQVFFRTQQGFIYRAGTVPIFTEVPSKQYKPFPDYRLSHRLKFEEALFSSSTGQNAVQRKSFGHGTRSDGGNGTRSDGGNRGGGAETNRTFLDTGIRFEIEEFEPKAFLGLNWFLPKGPSSALDTANRAGPQAIVLRAHNEKSWAANTASILWLLNDLKYHPGIRRSTPDKIRAVSKNEKFISSVWQDLKSEFMAYGDFSLRPQLLHDGTLKVNFVGRELTSKDPFSQQRATLFVDFNEETQELNFKIDLEEDSLVFSLGEYAQLKPNNTRYEPEISVLSAQKSELYSVDIESFMFEAADNMDPIYTSYKNEARDIAFDGYSTKRNLYLASGDRQWFFVPLYSYDDDYLRP